MLLVKQQLRRLHVNRPQGRLHANRPHGRLHVVQRHAESVDVKDKLELGLGLRVYGSAPGKGSSEREASPLSFGGGIVC